MKIVVVGGSGLIGKKLIPLLHGRGHEAVSASPSSGVNTVTGEGLAGAGHLRGDRFAAVCLLAISVLVAVFVFLPLGADDGPLRATGFEAIGECTVFALHRMGILDYQRFVADRYGHGRWRNRSRRWRRSGEAAGDSGTDATAAAGAAAVAAAAADHPASRQRSLGGAPAAGPAVARTLSESASGRTSSS